MNLKEVNCSVIGDYESAKASVCEKTIEDISRAVFEVAKIEGYLSSLSIPNIVYIMRKEAVKFSIRVSLSAQERLPAGNIRR